MLSANALRLTIALLSSVSVVVMSSGPVRADAPPEHSTRATRIGKPSWKPYEYRIDMIDAGGSGWHVVGKFEVKP
jgi:hypothetical protein